MKALLQKIPLDREHSFLARTFRTPDFEVGWHQHAEHELIVFTSGSGLSFIGHHVGSWETGDSYLLGADLPHTFQKSDPESMASAVVIQFRSDFWGSGFLGLPESAAILELLERSQAGLSVRGASRLVLQTLAPRLEDAAGFSRLLLLGECLDLLSRGREYRAVMPSAQLSGARAIPGNISKIFDFTLENFRQPITLKEVSAMACMSIPAFCNWFKKSAKKTYVDFLSEVRIGYACRLLLDTDKTVTEVAWESGYNTVGNFHKQFRRFRGISPLQYRKQVSRKLGLPQNNIHIIPEG